MERSALEPLTQVSLDSLREIGIDPTLEQVIRLNDAARQVHESSRDASARGTPVLVGDEGVDLWLWSMTVQAARWYTRAVTWSEDDHHNVLCLAFAMAHAREHGIFDYIGKSHIAMAHVTEWADSMPVTYQELLNGIAQVLDQSADLEPDAQPLSGRSGSEGYAGLIATLVEQTGITADYWESKCSIDYILHHCHLRLAQAAAGRDTLDDNDPWVQANRRLGIIEIEIKKEHAQAQADAVTA